MNFIQNIFQNNRNRPSRPRQSEPSQGGSQHPPSTATAAASSSSSSNRTTTGGNSNTNSRRNDNPAFGAPRPPPSQPRHEPAQPAMNPFDFFSQQLHAAAQSAFFGHPPHPHQDPEQPSRAAPPASTKAIRQLPTVSVTPEDLVDENNRECCICFEEHQLHDKVMRLPCAHIYHPKCIMEWLNRHCTCPVCRYELPTDNVVYERERMQRMKHRKPRYARYELERMQTKELKTLCLKLNVSTLGMMEKKEFVDALVQSEKIILISAPEPVEYQSVKALRSMGVGQLKKAMKEAGVFFDSKDVVEKEDMVQIFVNSGRIVFTEKEDESLKSSSSSHTASSENHCVDPYGNVCPDYNEKYGENQEEEEVKRARLDENGAASSSISSRSCSYSSIPDASGDMDVSNSHHEESMTECHTTTSSAQVENQEATILSPPSHHDETSDANNNNVQSGMNVEHLSETEENTMDNQNTTTTATERDVQSREQPSFASRSIGEIRQLASSLNVDVSSCIEKREMVQLIMEAIVKGARERPSSN